MMAPPAQANGLVSLAPLRQPHYFLDEGVLRAVVTILVIRVVELVIEDEPLLLAADRQIRAGQIKDV